ncbi:MAG: HutP family protein [Dialister micraerophilus]|uniref:HutP family protein n=1 Tax=Dialister micraerophilus TaxID=309120 RepID=UPI00254DD88E|nr:HutP family protein [Dialister micraerophilus]MDK8285778.1 HutP family protein [Dialister micraerophilus]MDU5301404.1 HutP family protein [Dialister micraerophilus]
MVKKEYNFRSIDVARFATNLVSTGSREKEMEYRKYLETFEVQSVAVDFGGKFEKVVPQIIENGAVAAQRCGLIEDQHVQIGDIVGAIHQVLIKLGSIAVGLNVGGKLAIARYKEHLCVAIFAEIGLIHLNEVFINIAHRSVPYCEKEKV